MAGQTDAMGRVVSGVWAGAPGNVRRGEHRERMMLPAEFSLELFIIQVGDNLIKYYVGIFR